MGSSHRTQNRKIAGEALQNALVGLVDLSLECKQLHWNVVGPHFRSVHLQLDDIVETAREHADVIAERAVTIGTHPDGRASTLATGNAHPRRPVAAIGDTQAIDDLIELLDSVIARLEEGIRETADPDPVSQDLLISAAGEIEKHRWMVDAQRQRG